MSACKNIALFGLPAACEHARLLLENHPQVKRIDVLSTGRLKLILSEQLPEAELLEIILPSGVSGLCIDD